MVADDVWLAGGAVLAGAYQRGDPGFAGLGRHTGERTGDRVGG